MFCEDTVRGQYKVLSDLIEREALRTEMARQAIDFVRERFSADKCYAELLELLH
jgi:hypothetical protein